MNSNFIIGLYTIAVAPSKQAQSGKIISYGILILKDEMFISSPYNGRKLNDQPIYPIVLNEYSCSVNRGVWDSDKSHFSHLGKYQVKVSVPPSLLVELRFNFDQYNYYLDWRVDSFKNNEHIYELPLKLKENYKEKERKYGVIGDRLEFDEKPLFQSAEHKYIH